MIIIFKLKWQMLKDDKKMNHYHLDQLPVPLHQFFQVYSANYLFTIPKVNNMDFASVLMDLYVNGAFKCMDSIIGAANDNIKLLSVNENINFVMDSLIASLETGDASMTALTPTESGTESGNALKSQLVNPMKRSASEMNQVEEVKKANIQYILIRGKCQIDHHTNTIAIRHHSTTSKVCAQNSQILPFKSNNFIKPRLNNIIYLFDNEININNLNEQQTNLLMTRINFKYLYESM
eukprot:NODE_61_length_26588_cov_1.146778.p8 type:complete len:236 gc:universal NODE_61_length_26588_cov_1.146778:20512-19805(-)